MIPFIGLTRSREYLAEMKPRRIGRLQVRGHMRLQDIYDGERWAYDNGAFSDWRQDKPFDRTRFFLDIQEITESDRRPVFAVLPDLPTQGEKSLEFSRHYLNQLKAPISWSLAIQNGQTPTTVARFLKLAGARVTTLFIGGDDSFKREARQWADFAHDHGLWCHYARASTRRKMAFAWRCGCDSFDTTQPLWEKGLFAEWLRFHDNHYEEPQTELCFEESSA